MAGTIRVLTIDGGGIRGIILARILAYLESITRRPIADLFDLIVGTSTGGILALGLTKPDERQRPAYNAEDLLNLYSVQGQQIFPGGGSPTLEQRIFGPLGASGLLRNPRQAVGQPAQRIGAIFGGNTRYAGNARYLPDGLESALAAFFDDTLLADALVDLVVTSYDMRARQPILFRRSEARSDPTRNPLMRKVARATSAAPTYFPPESLDWGGVERILIDGGVFANNPAMIGYVERLTLSEQRGESGGNMLLVSLGTGVPEESVMNDVTYDAVMSKNWLAVASDMLEVVFDGISDNEDVLLRQLAERSNSSLRYWRFQIPIEGASLQMDNANPGNVAVLSRLAAQIIAYWGSALTQLGEELLSGNRVWP